VNVPGWPALVVGVLSGAFVTRSDFGRRVGLPMQLVLAAMVGTCTLAVEMLALTLIRVRWTTVLLCVPALSMFFYRRRMRSRPAVATAKAGAAIGLSLSAASLALLGVALFSGRATSIDYLYFWGTKGFRFAMARGIDLAFLQRPDHYLLHSDYPPFVPLIYAAMSLVGGTRSWWLGLGATLFFAAGCSLAIWGICRERMHPAMAAGFAALGGALIADGLVTPFSGGNAEAILLFFACVALGLLTMFPRQPAAEWLGGVALMGAALTKIEGSVFALLMVLAFGLWRETTPDRWRRLGRLGLPPLAGLGTWLVYAQYHSMLRWYRQPYGRFTLHFFLPAAREFVAAASYRAGYLAWIVPALLWLSSPRRAEGLRPALVGTGYAGFALFCFLHGSDDPVGWVHVVAPRLLMTSVVAFLFAAAGTEAARPREAGPIEPGVPSVKDRVRRPAGPGRRAVEHASSNREISVGETRSTRETGSSSAPGAGPR
jgi:hypothetical protein